MKKKLTSVYMKVWAFAKRRPVVTGIAVVAVLAIGFLIFGHSSNGKEQTVAVTRGAFVQQVSVSGKVVAAQEVDLAFPETGRVESITAKVGDMVYAGQPLASLSMGTLLSDLRSAQANLALRKAEAGNAVTNVTKVKAEQEAQVQSAYAKLLSSSLTAVPRSSTYTVEAPTISGLYTGAEGTYEVRIERGVNADQYRLITFNLERTPEIDILKNQATPVGTRGLYISFSNDMGAYVGTTWLIQIPNVRAAVYAANYHAYQEALQTRDRIVAQAEAELNSTSGTAVLDAQIAQAEAEVARINASINERILRAPFAGVVTMVDIKNGGVASLNTPAISLMAADTLQVESYIPEIHVSLIERNDAAVVTLDAYGTEVPFTANVVSIDPAETVRDGVSTYRTILAFPQKDGRIKAGMTANVLITTEEKDDVLSVPQGVVTSKNGKRLVQVKEGEETVSREVTVGGVSSVGNIEIRSGLSEGEQVVVPAR